MFYTKLKDESGMALMIAVVVTMLGTLIVSSYMSVAINESRNSIWQKHRVQSLFYAEAGIEKAIYYLNNPAERPSGWVNANGQLLPTPLDRVESIADGRYNVTLHDPNEITWLPENSYLIRSQGMISQISGDKTGVKVSCIVTKKDEGLLSVPAALCIYDEPDADDELSQFASAQWAISGIDIDDASGATGVKGVAISNTGDAVDIQMGIRIDQVAGEDMDPTTVSEVVWVDADHDGIRCFHDEYIYVPTYQGESAILEDPTLPQNLSEYVDCFYPMATDISGAGTTDGYLGSPDNYQVLYADLSQGTIQHLGNRTGYGVLILEGPGEFQIAGTGEWYGLILCTGGATINLRGGGSTSAHVYGAVMVEDCVVTMNGTADIKYSSNALANIRAQLMKYKVISWSEGWGNAL